LRLKPVPGNPIPCVWPICLNDGWDGTFSLFNTITGGVDKLASEITKVVSPTLYPYIQPSLKSAWNKKTPPLPWDDGTGKPFTSELMYEKAYNEWRGKSCIVVPIINYMVCINNLLIPNKYADLFPYIPLSSTEDLKGSISVDKVTPLTNLSANGTAISNLSFSNQTPSTLFFPHMQESNDLANLLQNTFVSSGETGYKTANPTDVSSTSCDTVQVRTNKGDKLFATQLTGNLKYNANFSCTFDYPTCLGQACGSCCPGASCNLGIGICQQTLQTCTKDVYINLSTKGSIPKADTLWSQLVAGPESIFKRIFPKTNVTGSVGKIIDIPGSTDISYSGPGINQSDTSLKFPHIGGISEYFLKGIQTALRPKGFGDPITFDSNSPSSKPGEVDCDQTAPDIILPNTISKQDLHNLAVQWIGGKTGDHVLECYNDAARKSLAAGISPAFTFFMWIHESGGSNYTISNQDWGINSSSVVGFTAQLKDFLLLPGFYKSAFPQCFGKTRTDTETYFDLFAVGLMNGQCVPGAGDTYMTDIGQAWSWFTSCPMTTFPFSSSCY
jgi:hypothetical protein